MTTKQARSLIEKMTTVTTGMDTCLQAMDPTGEQEFTQGEIAEWFRRRIDAYTKKGFATVTLKRALEVLEGKDVTPKDYIIRVNETDFLVFFQDGNWQVFVNPDISKAKRYKRESYANEIKDKIIAAYNVRAVVESISRKGAK